MRTSCTRGATGGRKLPSGAVRTSTSASGSVPITIPWSSPRDGIVLQRNAIEGIRAQPGDVLFRIADISQVWATVDVAERDLGNVAISQPVTVRARSYPGRSFKGLDPMAPAAGSLLAGAAVLIPASLVLDQLRHVLDA